MATPISPQEFYSKSITHENAAANILQGDNRDSTIPVCDILLSYFASIANQYSLDSVVRSKIGARAMAINLINHMADLFEALQYKGLRYNEAKISITVDGEDVNDILYRKYEMAMCANDEEGGCA